MSDNNSTDSTSSIPTKHNDDGKIALTILIITVGRYLDHHYYKLLLYYYISYINRLFPLLLSFYELV
jgi:hypothetical protein